MACGVGMLGLGLGLYAKQAKALPPLALRPPGALPENDFLGACIRCGLCAIRCPTEAMTMERFTVTERLEEGREAQHDAVRPGL